MEKDRTKLGLCVTGSFCTFTNTLKMVDSLIELGYDITPIFTTATPITPRLMEKVWDVEPASWGWKAEQIAVNEWIMAQPYAVDVSTPLTDEDGEMKAELTTDGLHPDAEAKKIIGETIGKYLKDTFGLQ